MKYEVFKTLKEYIAAHPEKKESVTVLELAEYLQNLPPTGSSGCTQRKKV